MKNPFDYVRSADIDDVCERAQDIVQELTKERDDLKEKCEQLQSKIDDLEAELVESRSDDASDA
jgi:peptidoglycan hydrolase CwlO-like protein